MRPFLIFLICSFFLTLHAQERSLDYAIPDRDFERGLIISYEINRQNTEFSKYQKQLEHIKEIAYRIAAQTNDARPFTFQVINDPSVNAFALPGGFIFITSGMMNLKLSDEEWAHLFGHELTHITQNHHSRAASKALSQWPLILASLAASIYASYEMSKQNQNLYTNDSSEQRRQELNNLYTISLYGPYITSALYSLKFTRELENEADKYGRKYAAQAGFSSKGAENLFMRLSKTDNPHIDNMWRSHPGMLDRTFAATLSNEPVAEKDFSTETAKEKSSVQQVLYSYLSFYVAQNYKEKLRNGSKSLLNLNNVKSKEDEKAYHLIFLHLAELILGIDKKSDIAKKTIYIIAEQLLVLDSFNRTLAPWGKYNTLQKEIDSNNKYANLFDARASDLFSTLTQSFNENRAGIPTCYALLHNFPEHPNKFEIRLGLIKALFQNKNYNDIPQNFLLASQEAITKEQKQSLQEFGSLYIKVCENPYQLYSMAKAINDETFTNNAKNSYPAIIEKCKSLKDLVQFFETPESNELSINKEKIRENLLLKTFNRAKLLEKQNKKSEAAILYEEIISYGEKSIYVTLAQAAINTLGFE